MGYRGAPITQLSFGENGDCHGYLVGEANKGLSYMFQMMNEARLSVGFAATAIASAAYYAALQYTQERPQGRAVTSKDPTQPQYLLSSTPISNACFFASVQSSKGRYRFSCNALNTAT